MTEALTFPVENFLEDRSELIADMFHRVHFVEKWGRGIGLILSKEPTAEFKVVAGLFITTFKRKGVEKGVEKLSENEQKIIDFILKKPSISKAEIVEEGQLTKKTVEYNIENLKKKGLLKRVGPAKGGYWKVEG